MTITAEATQVQEKAMISNPHRVAASLILRDSSKLMKLEKEYESKYNFSLTPYVSHSLAYSPILSTLIGRFGDLSGKRVFEIGCGTGKFLYTLNKCGAITKGIEWTGALGNFSKQIGVDTLIDDIFCFTNSSCKFDAVISKGFLTPTILDPEFDGAFDINLEKFLRIAYNLTNDGGVGIHLYPPVRNISNQLCASIGYGTCSTRQIYYRKKTYKTILLLEK